MSESLPPDPFVNMEMLPLAKSAHDMFTVFLAVGFDRRDALHLTAEIFKTMITNAQARDPS